MNKDTD